MTSTSHHKVQFYSDDSFLLDSLRLAVVSAAFLLLGAVPQVVQAAELLRPFIAQESVRVAAAIREKKYETYRVDLLKPSQDLPNAPARVLCEILSQELAQQKLRPVDEGPHVRVEVQVRKPKSHSGH